MEPDRSSAALIRGVVSGPNAHAALAFAAGGMSVCYELFSTLALCPAALEADAEIAVAAAIADPIDSRTSAPLWRA